MCQIFLFADQYKYVLFSPPGRVKLYIVAICPCYYWWASQRGVAGVSVSPNHPVVTWNHLNYRLQSFKVWLLYHFLTLNHGLKKYFLSLLACRNMNISIVRFSYPSRSSSLLFATFVFKFIAWYQPPRWFLRVAVPRLRYVRSSIHTILLAYIIAFPQLKYVRSFLSTCSSFKFHNSPPFFIHLPVTFVSIIT